MKSCDDILKKLRSMGSLELDEYVRSLKKEMFSIKTESILSKKPVKPHLFSAIRRNIARALTIKTEKEG